MYTWTILYAEIDETTAGVMLTNDTIADNRNSFGSSYIYAIITVLAGLFITVGMSVIIMICIHHVRKRRRQTLCKNLESLRHYETVDESFYEMVLNETHHNTNSNTQSLWSDFNINCNEAYQKPNYIINM